MQIGAKAAFCHGLPGGPGSKHSRGLTQLGARQYDPNLGRFITVDPVLDTSEPRHANAYSYSYNSPVSYSDPTGLIGTRAVPDGGGGSRSNPGYSDKNTAPPPAPGNKPPTTNAPLSPYTSLYSAPKPSCGATYNPCLPAGYDPPAAPPGYSSVMAHGLLTTLGLVPGVGEIADFLDMLLCLAESDMVCAGLSATSMVPFAGWASAGAKYAKLGGEMADAASDTAALQAKATSVHSVLDPIAQRSRTTAALGTTNGQTVLASGGRDLSPAQRAMAADGDVLARSPGDHAEVTAVNAALESGLTPQAIGVSRKICAVCVQYLEETGATITSPTTATWR